MNERDRKAVIDGQVVGGGGRSPSAPPTAKVAPPFHSASPPGPLAPGQRWSAARKRAAVRRLMRGGSTELLSRELGLPVFKLDQWRQKAEAALEDALKGPGHCPGPRPIRLRANSPPPCGASAN